MKKEILLRRKIRKAIKEHFDGLVAFDKIPRTKHFLQLDCLEEDILRELTKK